MRFLIDFPFIPPQCKKEYFYYRVLVFSEASGAFKSIPFCFDDVISAYEKRRQLRRILIHVKLKLGVDLHPVMGKKREV